MENGLQEDQRPSEKCGNHQRDKLYRRNHENIKRLCRTIESSVKFKSDPIVVDNLKVANLSKKTFSTETFQMFLKNLFPTPKVYHIHRLNEETQIFYRTIKL